MSIIGAFISFNLPYVDDDGNLVSPEAQAETILSQVTPLMMHGFAGVAITYSANYGQTRMIEQTYFMGGWNTQTNGANQAEVMASMETLLGTSQYQAFQGKMRIVPITTLNAYTNPLSPWNDDVLLGIVFTDLERIKIYLDAGWAVLGWQNQHTVNTATPYAVGGGVVQLPQTVSETIQSTLINYADNYPNSVSSENT